MIRKRVEWKFRGSSLTLGERTLVMGILNVTPDSFSDGGQYSDPEAALRRAVQLQEQGADIIDIGAESTRPGSERISEAEELRRLVPVLKKLKGHLDVPISVDTYKPGVAEKAIEHGAHIINDVSGLTWEPELVKPVLNGDAGLILNHMRGTPEQWAKMAPMRDVMGEIAAELEAAVHRARRAGIDLDHIVVDPGIGFGKRKEQNSEILARLGELRRLLLPILVGPSRKSFLTRPEPIETDFATAAAVTAAILNGAYMVRVHDVAAMKPVVETTDEVIAAMPEPPEDTKGRRSARDIKRELDEQDEARLRPIRPPTKRAAATPAPREEERPAAPRRDEPIRPKRQDDAGSRPAYSRDRRDDRPDFKRGGDRDRREGDRPAYGGRSGSRPPREGGERGGQDRPYSRGGASQRGDRPPGRSGPPSRGGAPRGGERPPGRGGEDRPFSRGGAPRTGGDRPPGRSGPPSRGGAPRGGDKPPGRGGEDRPFGRSGTSRGGDRPPGRSGPPSRGGGDRPPARGGEGRPFKRTGPNRGGDRPKGGDGGPSGRGGAPRGGGRPPGRSGPPSRGGGRGPSTPRRKG